MSSEIYKEKTYDLILNDIYIRFPLEHVYSKRGSERLDYSFTRYCTGYGDYQPHPCGVQQGHRHNSWVVLRLHTRRKYSLVIYKL